MISKKHRFHGLNALNYAYKQGRPVRGSALALKVALNPRRRDYRVAVVVSKKVSKSAVVRNRIRRRVYETVRTQPVVIEKPLDLIFTVYTEDVATMPADQLVKVVAERDAQAVGMVEWK